VEPVADPLSRAVDVVEREQGILHCHGTIVTPQYV
jgi:hypothetical protein